MGVAGFLIIAGGVVAAGVVFALIVAFTTSHDPDPRDGDEARCVVCGGPIDLDDPRCACVDPLAGDVRAATLRQRGYSAVSERLEIDRLIGRDHSPEQVAWMWDLVETAMQAVVPRAVDLDDDEDTDTKEEATP